MQTIRSASFIYDFMPSIFWNEIRRIFLLLRQKMYRILQSSSGWKGWRGKESKKNQEKNSIPSNLNAKSILLKSVTKNRRFHLFLFPFQTHQPNEILLLWSLSCSYQLRFSRSLNPFFLSMEWQFFILNDFVYLHLLQIKIAQY